MPTYSIGVQEFLRPIITPYELEIALQAEPQWDGKYVLDFGKLAIKELPEESGTWRFRFIVSVPEPNDMNRGNSGSRRWPTNVLISDRSIPLR